MNLSYFPQETMKFEIQSYKKPASPGELQKTHVAFTGSPRRHPYDSKKVLLVADPYSTSTFYYEFKSSDVSYVEEMPSLVNIEGETIPMVRIWVKKMSLGIRSLPFVVDSTTFG